MVGIVVKALLIWMLIAVAEVLHGILRVRLLNRRVGDHRARQVAVFSGSAIILLIAWVSVPWIGVNTIGQCVGVGFMWLVLMLAFEIAFGRWVFRASWERIAADFDFRKGGLLSIGMLILLAAPLLVAKLKRFL
jgi:hypothetical protein